MTTVEPSEDCRRLLAAVRVIESVRGVSDRVRDRLLQAHGDLLDARTADGDPVGVLRFLELGTRERPRRVRAFDEAQGRCVQWIAERSPSRESRGGSRSFTEAAEGQEDQATHKQALADLDVFAGKALSVFVAARGVRDGVGVEREVAAVELAGDCAMLRKVVGRYVRPIDHSRLPVEIPGCVSCARPQRKGDPKSGHFAPVRTTAKEHGLCDACYRFALTARKEAASVVITSAHYPPLRFCDLMHRVSPQAAGRWLARHLVA